MLSVFRIFYTTNSDDWHYQRLWYVRIVQQWPGFVALLAAAFGLAWVLRMNRGGGDESKCSQIFMAFVILGFVAVLGMGVVAGVGTITVIDMNEEIYSYHQYQLRLVKYERDLTEWIKEQEKGKGSESKPEYA